MSGESGVLNTLINKLPVELHLPNYNWCGPSTKVQRRLLSRDEGINPLDEAFKVHDLIYHQFKDKETRQKSDKVLIDKAWQRFKSKNASIAEKTAAWIVTNAMKAKVHTGMGARRRKSSKSGSGRRTKQKKSWFPHGSNFSYTERVEIWRFSC